MNIRHNVEQGECILSICSKYQVSWQTIWNHPDNAALRMKRKQPTILMPGDVVVISKQEKGEGRNTGALHSFQIVRTQAVLRLQLFEGETPRANQTYKLTVDGAVTKGATDDQGVLEVPIDPDARQADLVVGPEAARHQLDLGFLDPVTEFTGVQARLQNLGYYFGEVDGTPSPETRRALMLFQRCFGLDGSGETDEKTQRKLEQLHDAACLFPDR